MVLPMLKVGSLLIKSLAKPFSKQIKVAASKSPVFHDNVVKMARFWHKYETKLSRFTGDNSRRAAQLNVNAAIDLGTEMVSEVFLLSVAVGLLLYENSRSTEKEKEKQEKLQNRFKTLEEKLESQNDTIEKLTQCIQILQSSNPNLNIYINDPSLENTHQPSSSSQSLELNKYLESIIKKKEKQDEKDNKYSSLTGDGKNLSKEIM